MFKRNLNLQNENYKSFSESSKKKITLWCTKWNRIIAGVLALIFFAILLYFSILRESNEHPKDTTLKQIKLHRASINEVEAPQCIFDACEVTCQDFTETNFVPSIHTADQSDCHENAISIILFNNNFGTKSIEKNWLADLEFNVVALKIEGTNLEIIGKGAFSGPPFEKLNKIEIIESKIGFLKQESFLGSKILDFAIRFNEKHIVKVEAGVFNSVSNYLTQAQFINCLDDSEALQNITGLQAKRLIKLELLDLSDNFLQKVTSNSFINAPILTSLYLIRNAIQKIEVDAFAYIGKSIEKLYISENALKTLENGLFNGFEGKGIIDVNRNNFRCDCDLVWFKEFYESSSYFENGGFFCNGNIPYKDVNFCADVPTSSTSSTPTTIVTSPSESDEGNDISIDCSDVQILLEMNENLSNKSRSLTNSVTIRNGTIRYSFYQLEYSATHELRIEGDVSGHSLILTIPRKASFYGCYNNFKTSIILDTLQFSETYTLCLKSDSETMVAPNDCTSLSVPDRWENQSWISNKFRIYVIAVTFLLSIAISLVTAFFVYCVIKRNPKLIKGNNRIVIMGKNPRNVIFMPKVPKRVPKQKPRIPIVERSNGYLTPKYEFVGHKKYVKAIHDDFDTSDPGIVRRRSILDQGIYESIDNTPPLPPNHPSEKIFSISK